jgi:hypothetical protein
MKVRYSVIVVVAAFMATASGLACYEGPQSFQPATYGAKPWNPDYIPVYDPDYDPNNPWNPQPTCASGSYVAIDSCPGCTGISYALCVGINFTQCVCGGPFWPGAECPKSLVCCSNDFPPFNWLELVKYAGPGWAGYNYGAGAPTRTCP